MEAISRLTEIGVGTSLEAGLERTERALVKLDEGTYGRCDVCGEPIAPKRLAAMPDVVTLRDVRQCPAARRPAVAPLGAPRRGSARQPAERAVLAEHAVRVIGRAQLSSRSRLAPR